MLGFPWLTPICKTKAIDHGDDENHKEERRVNKWCYPMEDGERKSWGEKWSSAIVLITILYA